MVDVFWGVAEWGDSKGVVVVPLEGLAGLGLPSGMGAGRGLAETTEQSLGLLA